MKRSAGRLIFGFPKRPIFLTESVHRGIVTARLRTIADRVRTPEFVAPCEDCDSGRVWKCRGETAASEFSRGRFWDLRGGRPADAAADRAAGVSQSLRISRLFLLRCLRSAYPAIPQESGLLLRWIQGRALIHRIVAAASSSATRSGERRSAGDRTGEAKHADRFCLHRNAARRRAGLPDGNDASAGSQLFYRARRPRSADRAHLQPRHL